MADRSGLYGVIMEAWVNGVSTRRVDALVSAIGMDAGMSRWKAGRICQGPGVHADGRREPPGLGGR
ncbi:MAG: hypothetical protein ACK41W_06870 [Cyanobacteriota bacterium]